MKSPFIIPTLFLLLKISAPAIGTDSTHSAVDTVPPIQQKFLEYLTTGSNSDFAELEYERQKFNGSLSIKRACKPLGFSLIEAGRFDKALRVFEDLYQCSTTDYDLFRTAKSGIICTYLMQNKPGLALNELEPVTAKTSSLDSSSTHFYKSVAYASLYDIDSALRHLKRIPSTSALKPYTDTLLSLLRWYRNHSMKNPLTAYLYSSALPGWGHWYGGHKMQATKSFMLMAGLTGLIGYEAYRFWHGNRNERCIRGMDIFLVWSLAWRRYYGSIRNASHQVVVADNQRIQLEFQKRLRNIILMSIER